ncbi:MAG TPA: GlxA family transcriptional regulator, partial [Phenylobacterium sp.]
MPRTLNILVFPDFQILDATGPIAAFEIAARFAPGAYQIRLVALEPGATSSSSGVSLMAEGLPDEAAHTLIVAGGDGTRPAIRCERTIGWL